MSQSPVAVRAPSPSFPSHMTALPISTALSGFLPDCRRYSVPVALVRVLRRSRALTLGRLPSQVLRQPAFQRQLALAGEADPGFFLSHKHFLVQGLSTRARVEAALAHYRHESEAFAPAYLDAVYSPEGLELWSETAEGTRYDIRLTSAHDVLTEGGLTVVLRVDGGRVCVLSFSTVPGRLLGAEEAGLVLAILRKQSAQDHSWQAGFNKAFDRVTAAHLCLGALSGLARAQGMAHLFGVAADRQGSFTEERREDFTRGYSEFWEAAGGRKASPMGYLLPAGLELTPLDEMNAKARKRARQRRAHIESVEARSADAIGALLRA